MYARVCLIEYSCTEVNYCIKNSVKIIAFVSDKERFHDKLENALSKTHHLTGVRMEIGKTGLPHRGARWIFIARSRNAFVSDSEHDPAQVLRSVSVRKCIALETLLSAVSSDLCAGWKAFSKKKSKKSEQAGSSGADGLTSSTPADMLGNMPVEFNPSEILDRYPYIKKPMAALGHDSSKKDLATRVAVLLYWLEQQNAIEGVVDVNKEKTPVCVDGTIPDTRGKKIYLHRSSKNAIALNPYHVLSTLGYKPTLHNLAVCAPATAETASKEALPCTLVFACILACRKTLAAVSGS